MNHAVGKWRSNIAVAAKQHERVLIVIIAVLVSDQYRRWLIVDPNGTLWGKAKVALLDHNHHGMVAVVACFQHGRDGIALSR